MGCVKGEDSVSCDEIRKKKGKKAWSLRKKQESDFKFVFRESSFGVFNDLESPRDDQVAGQWWMSRRSGSTHKCVILD